jgi:predicted permease
MDKLIQDLRYAARMMTRSPSVTLVAVLALALGIGATTAIFTVVDAVLLRPLPLPEADRLLTVGLKFTDHNEMLSYQRYRDLRARNRTLIDIAAYNGSDQTLTGVADPVHVDAMIATPNLFRVLGVEPLLGRGFTVEDERPGSHSVVITHRLWRGRYGGDPNIIGKPISLSGTPYTIVGVMPAELHFPFWWGQFEPELYTPLLHDAREQAIASNRRTSHLYGIARLKPGVTLAQARDDLDAVAATLRHDFPGADGDGDLRGATLASLREQAVRDVRAQLIMLLVAVACVLLIACANVAGLLLARATARQREIGIRLALGAGRGRIVRQMLTESALLGLVGGGLGVLLALWLLDLLVALVAPSLPHIHAIAIDGRALGVTFGLSILTGIAFGLVPALQASRVDLNDTLKETAPAMAHGRSRRARSALLVVEIAVALVLLVGAGLSLRSFARLSRVDLGFQPTGLVVAHAWLPDTLYHDPSDVLRYYRRLSQELASLPGTPSVAIGSSPPFTSTSIGLPAHLPGQAESRDLMFPRFQAVSPSYFATMGIALKRGRTFTAADDQPSAPATLVISEGFARRLFGAVDPLGKHVVLGLEIGELMHAHDCEVIGVVADVRDEELTRDALPRSYGAFGRMPFPSAGIFARSDRPQALLPELRRTMLAVDKDVPPTLLSTMDDLLFEELRSRRVLMSLLGLFAAVALILAVIGIYGVMSYTVSQRTREIGIRVALGAGTSHVITMVVGESLRLALLAVTLGVAAALGLGRLAQSQLYGVSSYDPLTLFFVVLIILVVCLLASFLPARRASKVDPMAALRYE